MVATVLWALVLALITWLVLGAVGLGWAGVAALIVFLLVLLGGLGGGINFPGPRGRA